MAISKKKRCEWAGTDELYISYHDNEWGVPLHDDRRLFEMLNLEGAQAGLSWLTILKKRKGYEKAFDNFNAKKIASYTEEKRNSLLNDSSIVRNRLKINATIENAKAFLKVQQEFGNFDSYIWKFVNNKPFHSIQKQEAVSISEGMSKDLKSRGFRFIGPTICYSFMQAVGMINDHAKDCFKFEADQTQ